MSETKILHDICKFSEDKSARYYLGKSGENKLFVIGLNPSTATQYDSDTTIAKVEQVAKKNKYTGFVMLNLYPKIETNPKDLSEISDPTLIEQNKQYIIEIAKLENNLTFWAAWGNDIVNRNYFGKSLKSIAIAMKCRNVNWLHYGNLTKKGHPRHPSRLSYEWHFQKFNIFQYIENLCQ